MSIEVPRDREGSFEPQVAPKHQREFKGFDDKILSMYSLGLTTRQIQEHLKDISAVDVSPELISRVTDEVKELVNEWRSRPLERLYPVLFLDALRVNIRDGAAVVKKSVYLALAIRLDGQKELGETKFRTGCGSSKTRGPGSGILNRSRKAGVPLLMGIMNELKNRGVTDILLAAVDDLSGFPDAIAAVFPRTEVQLCMVHMVRNSVRFVPYKDRRAVTAGLKKIYLSPSAELASAFKFSPEIRKAVYRTNAIESVNYTYGTGGQPSINLRSFTGKREFPYDYRLHKKNYRPSQFAAEFHHIAMLFESGA
jgi:transposase-like protein